MQRPLLRLQLAAQRWTLPGQANLPLPPPYLPLTPDGNRRYCPEQVKEEVRDLLPWQQDAMRVSDVRFTLRHSVSETMNDEVAEWRTEAGIPFKPDPTLPGRSGREWRIDYSAGADARAVPVSAFSTGARGAA